MKSPEIIAQLKITRADYIQLDLHIKVLWRHVNKANMIANYERGNFYRADSVKDLQTRFCFDIFHLANGIDKFSLANKLDLYLTRQDVGKALRRICPIVTRKIV